MTQPLVSFITPVYNTKKYLRECIDSVLNQKCPDWELILIDDGSTDGSEVICDEYSDKDNRIKVIHKNNSGQFETRLAGISVASGKYCTGLDSDDLIEENCVSSLSETLKTGDYDIVTWNIKIFDEDNKITCSRMERYGKYNAREFLEYVSRSTNHSFCNKLIRTELLKKSEYGDVPQEIRHSEDHILICPSICMAKRIIAVDEALYNYRQLGESVTHSYSSKRVLDYILATKCILNIVTYYSMRTSAIVDAEYGGLVTAVGYCLKEAYKLGMVSPDDIDRIRRNQTYKKLKKYENSVYLPLDTLVVLKLFRGRFDHVLEVMYGRRKR